MNVSCLCSTEPAGVSLTFIDKKEKQQTQRESKYINKYKYILNIILFTFYQIKPDKIFQQHSLIQNKTEHILFVPCRHMYRRGGQKREARINPAFLSTFRPP